MFDSSKCLQACNTRGWDGTSPPPLNGAESIPFPAKRPGPGLGCFSDLPCNRRSAPSRARSKRHGIIIGRLRAIHPPSAHSLRNPAATSSSKRSPAAAPPGRKTQSRAVEAAAAALCACSGRAAAPEYSRAEPSRSPAASASGRKAAP